MKRRPATRARHYYTFERLESRHLMAGASMTGLGAAGDSLSDEYSQTSFLETYQYAKSWVQLAVESTGLNAGPAGTYAEPRRSGYAYNWARYAATSGSLLSSGQHTSLAQQMDSGVVSHAVLAIGQNDFNPKVGSQYSNIYNGKWSAAQINSYVNQVVGNIETALRTLATTNTRLVVSNILDTGAAPAVKSQFPNASRRDRVTAVIDTVNARIATLADQYNVPLADLNGLAEYFFGTNTAPVASRTIGGVTINNKAGREPTNAFVHDGLHPHTVVQAQLANLFYEAFRQGYGAEVDGFSEADTVALVNLPYGGSDTAGLNFPSYVRMFRNSLPTLSGMPESSFYTENDAAFALAPQATVFDADSDPTDLNPDLNFALGTLTATFTQGVAGDRLELLSQGLVDAVGTPGKVLYNGVAIGSYYGGWDLTTPLQVSFNADATQEGVQAVVRSIGFRSMSDNPTTAVRTVSFQLDDGDGGVSALVTTQVNITPQNDAPTWSVGGEVSYVEDGPVAILAATPDLNDIDSPDFSGGQFTAALAVAQPGDVLSIRHQGIYNGSISVNRTTGDIFYTTGQSPNFTTKLIGRYQGGSSGQPLTVDLLTDATLNATQALLKNVVYYTLSNTPSTQLRSVDLHLSDGDGGRTPHSTVEIAVTANNDRPTITGNTSLAYSPDAAAVYLLSNAAVNDVDSFNFDGGRLIVSITSGGDSSNYLEIGGGFTVSGSHVLIGNTVIGSLNPNGGTGTTDLIVTFTANATRSVVQDLSRAITFRTAGSTLLSDRTVRFQLDDGDGATSLPWDVLVDLP